MDRVYIKGPEEAHVESKFCAALDNRGARPECGGRLHSNTDATDFGAAGGRDRLESGRVERVISDHSLFG
jgi:hypothetical protein